MVLFSDAVCVRVGESGEEVLYGTSDGQIGLIQLSRLCIKQCIYFFVSMFVFQQNLASVL